MVMKTSLKGVVEIAEHEGLVPAPYYDSVGVLTFGVGHTAAAGYPIPKDMPLEMPRGKLRFNKALEQAVTVFQKDLKQYEKRVNEAITVKLKQHEFDALVSFDFNTGGIYRAQLTKAINRRDKAAAAKFMGWLKPPEIRKRRTAEMNLFKTGNYDGNGNTVPVWKTNGRGKLIGIHSEMSGKQLIAMLDQDDVKARPVVNANPFVAFIEMLLKLLGGRK